MSEINTWSTTAASNNSAAPNGWPEGMNYSDVNNSARENMAAAARLYADMNGTLNTAGSADTYTLTPNRTISAYADGLSFRVTANVTNTGASTLNVSGLGAKAIKKSDGSALEAGDFVAGRMYLLTYDGTDFISDIIPAVAQESITVACSDETTSLTTGTAKVTFRMPFAMTLTGVRANVNTAPTGSTIIVDINESGTTILSTKLTIDAGEKTSTTAATAAVISDSALADDAEITIDIDQVGSTIAGKGLKVTLNGTRA